MPSSHLTELTCSNRKIIQHKTNPINVHVPHPRVRKGVSSNSTHYCYILKNIKHILFKIKYAVMCQKLINSTELTLFPIVFDSNTAVTCHMLLLLSSETCYSMLPYTLLHVLLFSIRISYSKWNTLPRYHVTAIV